MRINRTASFFVALSLLASTVAALSATANAAGNPNCNAVDGEYIVSFAPGANVDNEIKSAPGRAITTKFKYTKALNGFAANLSAEQVCAFQKRPNIDFVELNGFVTNQTTVPATSWGLDRIDQDNSVSINSKGTYLGGNYSYATSGAGVIAYIIDTGIYHSNTDFHSLRQLSNEIVGESIDDCNGHGTHVAGTVGGTSYGVAKGVDIVAVKVLGCSGSGSYDGVVAGIDKVIQDFQKQATGMKAVANMSLGGPTSLSIDGAVRNLISAGIVTVVAAGNSKSNACKSSPSGVTEAITVAASDIFDKLASYSNHGKCVDIIAPGSNIKSDYLSSTAILSGTSMASPHVAGVVARYLANPAATTASATAEVLAAGKRDKIVLTAAAKSSGTPNLLIYADPTK